MLKIENLHSYYGTIEALKGVNLEVQDGKISCVIGNNGAGKSTLLNAISGMLHSTGSIVWNGQELLQLSPKKIAELGIGHVPEGRLVFPGLTVKENLEVGTINWHGFFGREKYDDDMELVFHIFPRLKEREKQLAWSMSGGEQQMLAIGRALMGRPKLLMLDEPSMGLAPVIVSEMFEAIIRIKQETNLPILLIEQNARLALSVSDYAYTMENGKIGIAGPARELKNDARVLKAYLGRFA